MEELVKKITEMVEDIQPYMEFDESTNLLEEDILDSMSVLLLVQELEDEFNISIEMEEVTGENFTNILSVAKLIALKIGE